MTEIYQYIKAAFPYLWLRTHEAARAIESITHHPKLRKFKFDRWECVDPQQGDEIEMFKWLGAKGDATILFVENAHAIFRDNIMAVQAAQNNLDQIKEIGSLVIFLSPMLEIPHEMERYVQSIEFALPTQEEIKKIASELAKEQKAIASPSDDELDHVARAAAGLTWFEVENVLALSAVKHKRFEPSTIFEIKAQMVENTGCLRMGNYTETFDTVGGLQSMKEFCQKVIGNETGIASRGILALGVPGTGKSAFAKALGNAIGWPLLPMDMGAIFGSLVGQSEQKMRSALAVVDAMSPCILFIDEIEKGLSGSGSSGSTDGGTTDRVFGTFLTWLNDHESEVFVVGTCNDITKLPPEFARAERWDALFFVDLPRPAEREAIWEIYEKEYGARGTRPEDEGWTGAEIKTCCRLAKMLDLSMSEAADYVVPLIMTAKESIKSLREWAEGRCLDASEPGRYSITKKSTGPKRQRNISV